MFKKRQKVFLKRNDERMKALAEIIGASESNITFLQERYGFGHAVSCFIAGLIDSCCIHIGFSTEKPICTKC